MLLFPKVGEVVQQKKAEVEAKEKEMKAFLAAEGFGRLPESKSESSSAPVRRFGRGTCAM